jgi:hypothetical protein
VSLFHLGSHITFVFLCFTFCYSMSAHHLRCLADCTEPLFSTGSCMRLAASMTTTQLHFECAP